MSANILGLDNAATPFGIKAMQDMQTLSPQKDTLTNSQILFLVLNTSAVTLFPISVFLYRAEQGAAQPTDVFIPILLATSCSTLVGLFVTCAVQRINLFNRVVLTYLVGGFSLLATIILYFSKLASEQLAEQSSVVANFALFSFIVLVLVTGWRKKQNTYEQFVEGAKQGDGWKNLVRNLSEYDGGLLIRETKKEWRQDEWKNIDKREYQYNESGFKKNVHLYFWSDENWVIVNKDLFKYNENNKLINATYYIYNGEEEIILETIDYSYFDNDVAGITAAILVSYWFFA